MDADKIIKGIVEKAIATTENVHPGAIPIDDLARNAARLAFVAGMREAARMVRESKRLTRPGIANDIEDAADAIEREA